MASIFAKLKDVNLFSASEYEVVKFILAKPQKVVHMSIRSIAEETYTSPSTIMRTCRKLSDGGFAEFRIQLAKEIMQFKPNEAKTSHQEAMAKKMENTQQIMSELKDCVINSINCTQELINADIIENVIQTINKAKTIDIYGRGSSNSVGRDFRYKMFRLGYNVHLFEGIDLQAIQALNSDDTHCAIIISSSGETPEIINFAKILNANATPVITITGSQDCTLLQYSDYPLFIKCFETNKYVGGITSRSAMQYVLDTIYFAILNLDHEHFSQKILATFVPDTIANK
ncbi:MAG: MurR/RpiR family transcriptional regulator [Erysipelotrichaceae bacterium]|nr:MurR/RpiR family transcriptional regulator [Erysipelotrichaceae bacterium]MDY5251935.1 MurR/RpiR family transcriptional regulator [Erysipelotrichaceae bacterium]